ncbi:DUF1127 domain-containing protein [Microvirga sp. ACRRW]|uniref:DUF1127 domain-containing protein n=1 Tax=Microvirga sp. ACRRW TaxID=2918205 RepID=UPI001EF50F64|nr:DUF1127 domain-containing protein [Microvirga sp. ACRRW]MCG7394104.1 DUF1127 domain-containing protein [Microvirga sp. ACRRW]
MRYEDARRLRGVESVWLRVKLWLGPGSLLSHEPIAELSHLSDHERRDIGLHETARYLDGEPFRSKK